MIKTYKYINDCYDVKSVLRMDTHGKTRGYEVKIFTERHNTNFRKRAFSIRVALYWNRLPRDVVNAKSLNNQKETG